MQLQMSPMLLAKTCSADVLRGFNVGQQPQGADVVADGEAHWTRQHEPEFAYNVNEVFHDHTIGHRSWELMMYFRWMMIGDSLVKVGELSLFITI